MERICENSSEGILFLLSVVRKCRPSRPRHRPPFAGLLPSRKAALDATDARPALIWPQCAKSAQEQPSTRFVISCDLTVRDNRPSGPLEQPPEITVSCRFSVHALAAHSAPACRHGVNLSCPRGEKGVFGRNRLAAKGFVHSRAWGHFLPNALAKISDRRRVRPAVLRQTVGLGLKVRLFNHE